MFSGRNGRAAAVALAVVALSTLPARAQSSPGEPEDEHAEAVRREAQELEEHLAGQREEPKPAMPAAAPSAAMPAPPPRAAATAPPAAPPPPPSPAPPEPNRLPAFIALGAGGLMASGALVTGFFAQSEHAAAKDPTSGCSPSCSDDQLSAGRALAVTSTVLTGVAVVGVGLGVTLLLLSGGEAENASHTRPRLDVALGPNRAAASAAWSF